MAGIVDVEFEMMLLCKLKICHDVICMCSVQDVRLTSWSTLEAYRRWKHSGRTRLVKLCFKNSHVVGDGQQGLEEI